jgi:hypothetical protein
MWLRRSLRPATSRVWPATLPWDQMRSACGGARLSWATLHIGGAAGDPMPHANGGQATAEVSVRRVIAAAIGHGQIGKQ